MLTDPRSRKGFRITGWAPMAAALLLSVGSLYPPPATAGNRLAGNGNRLSLVTFRLHVSGRPAPDTTFRVAYGPLAGRFGLIRLHAASQGIYLAQRRLPASRRTSLAYIAGHGTVRTRYGLEPDDPVVTIWVSGPAPLWQLAQPTAEWRIPVG